MRIGGEVGAGVTGAGDVVGAPDGPMLGDEPDPPGEGLPGAPDGGAPLADGLPAATEALGEPPIDGLGEGPAGDDDGVASEPPGVADPPATMGGVTAAISGSWLTDPSPPARIAAPARTRFKTPRAITRRARWAVVTVVRALPVRWLDARSVVDAILSPGGLRLRLEGGLGERQIARGTAPRHALEQDEALGAPRDRETVRRVDQALRKTRSGTHAVGAGKGQVGPERATV